MEKVIKTVKASSLPKDTPIWIDDSYFTPTYIGEVLDEIIDAETEDDVDSIKGKTYWIQDLVDMPKPNLNIVDNVGEQMDDECEDWSDRHIENLEELEKTIQIVLDLWRDRVEHKVYGRNTQVIFD